MPPEVGMVKPGGTGRPRLAISARLAPLPPSRSRRPALPSALPSPNVYTHLFALMASVSGLFAGAGFLAAFATGAFATWALATGAFAAGAFAAAALATGFTALFF